MTRNDLFAMQANPNNEFWVMAVMTAIGSQYVLLGSTWFAHMYGIQGPVCNILTFLRLHVFKNSATGRML